MGYMKSILTDISEAKGVDIDEVTMEDLQEHMESLSEQEKEARYAC